MKASGRHRRRAIRRRAPIMSATSKNAATQTVDVGGTPFAYREVGPATGVPVVFLHHFTAVLDDWDPAVVDGIAAERRVILVDLRGVGGSGGTTPDSIEAMAGDAVAFLEALELSTVDLLGYSLGGMVAPVLAPHWRGSPGHPGRHRTSRRRRARRHGCGTPGRPRQGRRPGQAPQALPVL